MPQAGGTSFIVLSFLLFSAKSIQPVIQYLYWHRLRGFFLKKPKNASFLIYIYTKRQSSHRVLFALYSLIPKTIERELATEKVMWGLWSGKRKDTNLSSG